MPVYKHQLGIGVNDWAWRYREPLRGQDVDTEALAAQRSAAIRERDWWLALQKTARDRELGRFCREEAAYWLKRYRAACFLLGWHVGPAGDRPVAPPSLWPVDLAEALDYVFDAATV